MRTWFFQAAAWVVASGSMGLTRVTPHRSTVRRRYVSAAATVDCVRHR